MENRKIVFIVDANINMQKQNVNFKQYQYYALYYQYMDFFVFLVFNYWNFDTGIIVLRSSISDRWVIWIINKQQGPNKQ